jgi:hypothetical protein
LAQVDYVRVVDLDIGASKSDICAIGVVTISERAGKTRACNRGVGFARCCTPYGSAKALAYRVRTGEASVSWVSFGTRRFRFALTGGLATFGANLPRVLASEAEVQQNEIT